MNIFYGVIILNLEELSEEREEKEKNSREENSEIELEMEMNNIRGALEQSRVTQKKKKETLVPVEIEELSIEQMVVGEQAETPTEEEEQPTMKVKNILNIALTLLITINLALEFEGQSSDFAFLTDAVDFGLFLCCFCVIIFTIVIEIKADKKLSLPTIIDIVLFVVYGSGMVYEAAIA